MSIINPLPNSPEEALKMIPQPGALRPFDAMDFEIFAGVESGNPLISYEGDYVVVEDDQRIWFFHYEDDTDVMHQRVFTKRELGLS